MFDSLDEQIKQDTNRTSSSGSRMMLWAFVVLAALVVFGGLILGVHLMS